MSRIIKPPYFSLHLPFVKRIFMSLLVLGLSLSVPALLVPGPVQKNSYMGAQYCGSCHQEEYTQWLSSPHANAFVHLPKVSQNDPACLSCHATGVLDKNEVLPGVQCEACHGPGQYYGSLHVKKDPVLSKLMFMQKPNEDSCRHCHSPTENLWSAKLGMKQIDHWTDLKGGHP